MTDHMRGWRIGALAALLALIVRLAVPIGFMPMAGAAALIPCPAQIALPMKIPAMHEMHHGKAAHDDHDADRRSCPFAGVAAVTDSAAPIAPLLPLVPQPVAHILVRPIAAMPGLGLAAPPPPKTGPPTVR